MGRVRSSENTIPSFGAVKDTGEEKYVQVSVNEPYNNVELAN